jgi:hypothetical protein
MYFVRDCEQLPMSQGKPKGRRVISGSKHPWGLPEIRAHAGRLAWMFGDQHGCSEIGVDIWKLAYMFGDSCKGSEIGLSANEDSQFEVICNLAFGERPIKQSFPSE